MSNPDQNSASLDGIAIVGLAGRFPGARNLDEFWQNLRNGVESVSFFTAEELAAAGVSPTLLADPDFVRAKAVLVDADMFDADFFGYIPSEVEMMDPQQRVFLECAWSALEDAGYDPARFAGLISVFGGMSQTTYLPLLKQLDPGGKKYNGYPLRLGTDKDYLTTRVSYKLNLRGPSMNVQTACSTSLVAICQACQNLLSYQSDLALAGGVAISIPFKGGHLYQEGGIHSSDGHCRAFDATSQGIVEGDGVGLVVLKRLADAVSDGDTVHAVIKGFALNNDGSAKVGFTAPSPDGQAEAIASALALAGFAPETISYVEAHGTGTPLGDPIEIAGLTKAYRAGTERTNYCAIGSVKTNVGHLDTAAGVTGLIKTVLALRHGEIPPSLHFSTPNPKIDFAHSPFFVNAKLSPWIPPAGFPRRAGVSSFGLGGTNSHVVLEEAPALAREAATPLGSELLVWSARTTSALDTMTANLAATLKARPDANLSDIAHTLQAGRQVFPERRIVVAENVNEAAELLGTSNPKRIFSGKAPAEKPLIAFIFPGQGAQQVNMGRELYANEPVFREQIDTCAKILLPQLGCDLRKVLYPDDARLDEATRELTQTWLTQPAMFVVEYALARLWMSWGIVPDAMLGHSVGEYVAACVAEVLTLEDALTLLAGRARLMQNLPGGSMFAVRLSAVEVTPLLDSRLSLAAINSPNLCTVSGPTEAINEFEQKLKQNGVVGRALATSHAFHSAMMDPIAEPFAALVKKVRLSAPKIPYISNVTSRWITESDVTKPDYWFQHLRGTVHFADGIGELAKESRRIFLEVGPGQSLCQLARQHPARTAAQSVLPSIATEGPQKNEHSVMLSTLGRLWIGGAEVDWTALHHSASRRRVTLPTYPFERKRHWPSAVETPAATPAAILPSPLSLPASLAMPSPTLPVALPPVTSRKERVLAALKDSFQELSGIDVAQFDINASFLDLGFDSLFLTRAQMELRKKFGVRITFRQLFEEAPSMDALATYIEAHLPADKFAAPPPPAPVAPAMAAGMPTLAALHAGLADGTNGSATLLERVIAQQMQIMAAQIEALRGLKSGGDASLALIASNPTPAPAAATTSAADTPETTSAKPKYSGPWKPITKNTQNGLTDHQQNHLNAFIERYCRRTAGSKRLTAEQRVHLSDPRAVSGFRQVWKELVYQIAVDRSAGAKMWDVDGNEYVDGTMGFGINLFGYSPPFITQALAKQLEQGIELGVLAPNARKVADLLCEVTGMERVSFVNTGSEANMAAVRAARTVTGRDRIVVFVGSYHGIFDEVLVNPISIKGGYRPTPVSPGILQSMVDNVTVLDYGDPKSIETLRQIGHELAAVFVEPVQSRHPDLQPREFLHALRKVTHETGTALIFDEVITGFRLHPRGAQGYFGVEADIASYGKLVGGGIAMAVVAGKAAYLDAFDGGPWNYGDDSFPEAGVTFFGGTFVKHPLALAASAAALEHMKAEGPQLQQRLNERSDALAKTLNDHFEQHRYPLHAEHCGSMFHLSFKGNDEFGRLIYYFMRDRGFHVYDRPFYLSTAHTDADIEVMVRAFKESAAEMRAAGFLPEVGETATAISANATGSAAAAQDKIPLSAGQKEIWLAAQLGSDAAGAFNLSLTVELSGSLQADALIRALNQMVARHEAIRTVISPDGDYQTFLPELRLTVPIIDLSNHPEDKKAGAFTDFVQRDSTQPFDLEKGPFLRASLIKLSATEHRLVLTWFHIICDGWSVSMVIKDLSEYYTANTQGTMPHLPEAMQYGQYLKWRTEPEQVEEAQRSEKYWLKKFADSVPVLDLPTDRSRPRFKTYNGGQESLMFDRALIGDLTKTASRLGCTKFAALLGTFAALLHRLSGQDDVVLGLAAAGQAAAGNDYLVGHCVSLLPYRSRLSGDVRFQDHLRTTKTSVMDAYDHQSCTYGDLIGKMNLPRDPSRLPLASVIITHETDTAGIAFSGLENRVYSNPKPNCNFDLELYLTESASDVTATLCFNTDLFSADTIKRWLRHYENLLRLGIAHPEVPVGELTLLSPDDEKILLRDWNATAQEYPRQACVHHLVEAQAKRVPDRVAAVFGEQQLTYRELNTRADALARHLQSLGVGPDKMVGICVERSLEMLVGVLAILKAGGAYVPIDPAYPGERIAYIVQDTKAPVLITQRALVAELPATESKLVVLDEPLPTTASPSGKAPEVKGGNLAYVIYTSGSTGRPKGVLLEHRGVVNVLQSIAREPGFTEKDTMLAVTTLSFDIAVAELFLPLTTGGRLVLVDRETSADGAQLKRVLETSGATFLQPTPVTWRLLLDAGWTGSPKLRMISTGEPLPRELATQLLPMGESLWNLYGPTETTIWSTGTRVTQTETPITIGRPVANTQLYIVDSHMKPVPVGVPGELLIGGDGLARGYLHRPDLTAEKFIANSFDSAPGSRLYRTGDLARWLPDSSVECLGRIDHQVKLRGYRIELGEIETVLEQHPSVQQAVVVARETTPGTQRLIAYFAAAAGAALPQGALREHLRQHLPEYMIPQQFILLPALPLTPNGKVDRKALPAPKSDETGLATTIGGAGIAPAPSAWLERESDLVQRLAIPTLENFGDFEPRINQLCAAYMVRYLSGQGIEFLAGKQIPSVALKEKLKLIPDFDKFVEYMLDVLTEDGWLERRGGNVHFKRNATELTAPDTLHREVMTLHPQFSGLLRVVKQCGDNLQDALSDEIPAITVLCPDGKRDDLDRMLFKETIECSNLRIYEELAREFLVAQAREKPIRILEVGGGNGLLSWRLLPELAGLKAEYVFTDLGITFVAEAKKKAAKLGLDFVSCQKLDITRPTQDQGFKAQSFDLIFGLNVVHATPDIRGVLAHLKPLLKPAGSICLVELVKAPRWENLIWGFAKGWWLFRDTCRTNVPLVGLDVWENAFQQEGFNVWALPAPGSARKVSEAGLIVASLPSASASAPAANFVAPRNDTETKLATVWRHVLRAERIGVNDNFFELGGDSILAIRVISLARQEGLGFSLRTLFAHQTIAELATVATAAKVGRQSEQGLVRGSASLTPIQRWLFEEKTVDPQHFNQAHLFLLQEPLQSDAFYRALQWLEQHHDSLRLRFRADGTGPVSTQTTAEPTDAPPLEKIDLSSVADKKLSAAITEACAKAQASLDIAHGPVWRVLHLDLGAKRQGRIFLAIHHLAVDGVSWRILMEDLEQAYRQICAGGTVRLPAKTNSFFDWARLHYAESTARQFSGETDYWVKLLKDAPVALPVDFAGGDNTEGAARTVVVSLDAANTQTLLQKAPAAYNTQINDLLLTALGEAITHWTGKDTACVNLEGHGREDVFEGVDVSRTAGWFTTLYPVRLQPAGSGPGDHIKAVKEQLRGIPHRGFGYGICRRILRDPKLTALPEPQLVFNYLGQMDQMVGESKAFGFAGEDTGPAASPRQNRTHTIAVNGMVLRGKLEMHWSFSDRLHRPETVAKVAQSFIQSLEKIIEHCATTKSGGFTPSDFASAGLSQKELGELLADLGE